MNRRSEVAAILLAAGRSRRMGAFKPLLPFGARTVAECCVENLRAAGVDETVVVLGHRGAELRERLINTPGVSFAFNDEAESEMGASIARGVEALTTRTKAVLIALVDEPAVPPRAIRAVVEAHASKGARLVVPQWEGRGGHPVLVDMEFRNELLELDARGGLRALFDAHRPEVLRLPVNTPYIRRDMDTWEDYRALHREVFGFDPPPAIDER